MDARTPAIETEGLVKVLGATRAVDGIDLTVATGTVVRRSGAERRRQDSDDPGAGDAPAPDGGTARVLGHWSAGLTAVFAGLTMRAYRADR
jgi:ABC-2 type transport system ATP-binding protein